MLDVITGTTGGPGGAGGDVFSNSISRPDTDGALSMERYGGDGGAGVTAAGAGANGGDGGKGGSAGNVGLGVAPAGGSSPSASAITEGGAGATGGGGGDTAKGGNGGAGGSAGTASVLVSGTVSGTVTARSEGGAGGKGGNGGDSTLAHPDGNAGNGGAGGNGGNAGAVRAEINGRTGAVIAESLGGDVGSGGNRGGTGGSTGLRGTEGGDAGKVDVFINGTTGAVTAASKGGDGIHAGDSGNVTVTVRGTINGTLSTETASSLVDAAHGQINVVLDGGVVTGLISANAAGRSTLTFDFDMTNRSEFEAAGASFSSYLSGILVDPTITGSATINGKPYSWTGFDSLSNLLRYTGPNDVVVVTVGPTPAGSGSSVGDAFGTPRRAGGGFGLPSIGAPVAATGPVRCLPRTFTAQRQGDGSVRLISKMLQGSGFFEFGFLRGTTFDASPGTPDWSVTVVTDKRNQHAEITDASGKLIGVCVLAGRPPQAFAALR